MLIYSQTPRRPRLLIQRQRNAAALYSDVSHMRTNRNHARTKPQRDHGMDKNLSNYRSAASRDQRRKKERHPLTARRDPSIIRLPGKQADFFRPAPPADAGRQTTAETRTVGAACQPADCPSKSIARKAPRAVLCTLPRFLSLGVTCLLSAERKPSRPQGRARASSRRK